jgi:hypothetical protein
MYRLWSEWDIGESDLIFANKEAGMRWLRENPAVAEIAEDGELGEVSVEDCITSCFDEGYFSWQVVEVIQ